MKNKGYYIKKHMAFALISMFFMSCGFGYILDYDKMSFEWLQLSEESFKFNSNISDKYVYIKTYDKIPRQIKDFAVDISINSGSDRTLCGIVFSYIDRYNYSCIYINNNGCIGYDTVRDNRKLVSSWSITSVPGIHAGFGATNKIAIRHDGIQYFNVYFNDIETPIYSFASVAEGLIGFLCGGESSNEVDCDFLITTLIEY